MLIEESGGEKSQEVELDEVVEVDEEMRTAEAEERKKKSILSMFGPRFEHLRRHSPYARNGKNSRRTLHLYHHLENLVASALQIKKKGLQEKKHFCELKHEVRKIQNDGYQETKIEELLQKAEEYTKSLKQTTIKNFFQSTNKAVRADSRGEEERSEEGDTGGREGEDEAGGREGEVGRELGRAQKLATLAAAMSLSESVFSQNYEKNCTLDLASGDTAKAIADTIRLRNLHNNEKMYTQRHSRFSKVWREYEESFQEVSEAMTLLSQLLTAKTPNLGFAANMQETIRRAHKVNAAETRVVVGIGKLRKAITAHKRELAKRLSQTRSNPRAPSLDVSNFSLEWWQAMDRVHRKFEEKYKEMTTHNQSREIFVSGFDWNTFKTVHDHFIFLTYTRQEFTTITELCNILCLPGAMKPKLLRAVKDHLPIAELNTHGQTVLLDSARIRADPSLLIKLSVLKEVVKKRVLRSHVTLKCLGKKQTRRKPTEDERRKKAEKKYKDVLPLAQQLVETGLNQHGGIEADLRRR